MLLISKRHSNSPQSFAVNVTITRSSRTFEKRHRSNENAILIGNSSSRWKCCKWSDRVKTFSSWPILSWSTSIKTHENFWWQEFEKMREWKLHWHKIFICMNDGGLISPFTMATLADWHMFSNIHFSCWKNSVYGIRIPESFISRRNEFERIFWLKLCWKRQQNVLEILYCLAKYFVTFTSKCDWEISRNIVK